MEYYLLVTEYYDCTETFYSLHNSIGDALDEARECLTGRDGVDENDIPALLESLEETKGLDVPGLYLSIEKVQTPENTQNPDTEWGVFVDGSHFLFIRNIYIPSICNLELDDVEEFAEEVLEWKRQFEQKVEDFRKANVGHGVKWIKLYSPNARCQLSDGWFSIVCKGDFHEPMNVEREKEICAEIGIRNVQ